MSEQTVQQGLPIDRQERQILMQLAKRPDLHGQRAQAFLALANGASRMEAASQTGLSIRQVGYAVRRFRTHNLAMFPIDDLEVSDTDQDQSDQTRASLGEPELIPEPTVEASRQAETPSQLPTTASALPEDHLQGAIIFRLPIEVDVGAVLADVTRRYSLADLPPMTQIRQFYDSFDWRLYNRGLYGTFSANKWWLGFIATDEMVQQTATTTPFQFAWEAPSADLQAALAPLIDVRALLLQAETQTRSQPYQVLNKRDEVVARIGIETIYAVADPAVPILAYIWLKPQPKQRKRLRQFTHQCAASGLTPMTLETIYQEMLQGCGRSPGTYSTKLKLKLKPALPAAEAAKILLRSQVPLMQQNEAMLRQDIDTEFLHDFRIAVRRTRSVLSQLKGVFPVETTQQFRQDFKQIGQLTNELRDLDVYLLSRAEYEALLPEALRAGIVPLFEYLAQKRAQAFQAVVNRLNETTYHQPLAAWQTFLDSPLADDPTAPNAKRPIRQVAQARIRKIYKRIVKAGERILQTMSDEGLHDLRIECKKLRYLLEFFRSLFPRKAVLQLTKHLKRLQRILGEFNDLHVQETYLLVIATEMAETGRYSSGLFLSIGALVQALAQKRAAVKASFTKIFTAFVSQTRKNVVQAVFVAPS